MHTTSSFSVVEVLRGASTVKSGEKKIDVTRAKNMEGW